MNKLNVNQAAEYSGVSASFLNKRRVYGGGPLYIKVGKRIVYDRLDVDDWLAARKISSTSQQLRQAA